jgi:hypothetical protein
VCQSLLYCYLTALIWASISLRIPNIKFKYVHEHRHNSSPMERKRETQPPQMGYYSLRILTKSMKKMIVTQLIRKFFAF